MTMHMLGDRAVSQIAKVIADNKQRPTAPVGSEGGTRNVQLEQIVCGKLDTALSRNGTATLSIYNPITTGTAGGIGSDTNINITVIDNGKVTSGTPIPVNAVCDASYIRGAWVVIGYDCSAT